MRDEHGILHLSKNAKAFHPGQGVYRSSYMNARRLAATEINIAYRTADHIRQQQLDFVVGIEIHLSNNHTCKGPDGKPHPFYDICDELQGRYPKEFKFTGWHPHCRCYVTTVLKTPEEFKRDRERILNGGQPDPQSKNTVKDMPPAFKEWLERNHDRIAKAKSLPYFLRDNGKMTDGEWVVNEFESMQPQEPTPLEIAAKRHAARTPQQVQDIRDRWQQRENALKSLERLENDYGSIKDYDGAKFTGLIGKYGQLQQAVDTWRKVVEAKLNAMDMLDDPKKWAEQFLLKELEAVQDAVKTRISSMGGSSLLVQKSELEYEIWVADKKKYITWEVAQSAYRKQLGIVKKAIAWEGLKQKYADLQGFKTHSKYWKQYIKDYEDAVIANDAKAAKVALDKAEKLKSGLEAKAAAKAANKTQAATSSVWNSTKQKDHPPLMKSTDEMMEYTAKMTGSTLEEAREFNDAAYSFTYQWDYEIRAFQSGRHFVSKHGHSLDDIRLKADRLEEFIRRSPKWDGGKTYRGMTLSETEVDNMRNALKNGTFDNRGTASWSTLESKAEDFSYRKLGEVSEFGDFKQIPVMLCIKKHKNGTSIMHLSEFSEEYEVIASKDSRYRLVKEEFKGEIIYFEIEEL